MDSKLKLTHIPRELRLILDLLKKGNESYVYEHKVELFESVDWDLFIELAKHHRVYPLLYSRIKQLDDNLIPFRVKRTLKKLYQRNTYYMIHLAEEMRLMSQLFNENNISSLFLKGPGLAHALYGDISLRTSNDLDVLLPIDQLKNAENILTNNGYVKDDYIQTVLNDWKWRHHHVTFIHPIKKVKIEIHWRINPGPAKEPDFNLLWKRKSEIKIANYPIFCLGEEDQFFLLVTHGSRHGWSRLRWVFDIHQSMKQRLDWDKAHKILVEYNVPHIGGQGIFLSSQLLNSALPNEVKPLINRRSIQLAQQAVFYLERMVNLHTEPVPEDIASYHRRHLFSLMSIQQKVLFILSFLYPYPEDAVTLPLPKQFHILYFPLRPLLWAWRKRGNAFYHRGKQE